MRKLLYVTLLALVATVLVSCAKNKPAINVGNMTVKDHSLFPITPELTKYCGDYQSFSKEPVTQTYECEVPLSSKIEIAFAWGAKDTTVLDSNWGAMTWELSIDEYQVSLDEFELSNTSGQDVAGNQVKGQGWTLDLINLAPGKHTLRLLWKSETPIDDGFDIYAPGTHENIVNFTVLEK